jgi:hypothetical protein
LVSSRQAQCGFVSINEKVYLGLDMPFGRKNEDEDLLKVQERAERDRLKSEAKERKSAERVEKAKQKASEAEAREVAERLRKQREIEQYGRLVIEQDCGTKCVRIYDKGFVRVSGIFLKDRAIFEKLNAISSSAEVAKKTGLGRTLMAGVTLGVNLTTTSNQRGDLYLTISTDRETHLIHVSPPTERDMKAMHKLATAGQGVLDMLERSRIPIARAESSPEVAQASVPMNQNSLADELMKLVALRDAGELTEEEFLSMKRRLIS